MSSIAERAQRARRGSNRQRDLVALQAEEHDKFAVPEGTHLTQQSVDAWAEVVAQIHRTFHRSAWVFWIEPCPLVGEHNGALVIAGHPAHATWVRKRYAKHIGKAIRKLTTYRGLRVCDDGSEA